MEAAFGEALVPIAGGLPDHLYQRDC